MTSWLLALLLVIVTVQGVFAANTTINPLPGNDASFYNDLQNFLSNEIADTLGRYFPTDWVVSGGIHTTAATCTSPSFNTEAYTGAGDRVTATGVTIDYAALSLPGCISGTTTATVAICSLTGTSTGNWVRSGSSAYFVNYASPGDSTPTNCARLMSVVLTNGAITSVADVARHAPSTGSLGEGSVGGLGVLQAANGSGGFAAYAGDNCAVTGQFMTGITAVGGVQCGSPSAIALTSRPLLATPNSEFPNGTNVGALAAGLIKTTPLGGIANLESVPLPAGSLVGTTETQTIYNKLMAPRSVPVSGNVTPLTLTADVIPDVFVISNLQQNTLFANPVGQAEPWQWLRIMVYSDVVRNITWDTGWAIGQVPLPTRTVAGKYILWVFQYNPSLGLWEAIYDGRVFGVLAALTFSGNTTTLATTSGSLTPGNQLTTDASGNIIDSGVAVGSGGGGSGSPAGNVNDVQLKGSSTTLTADTGGLAHNPATHMTVTQGLQVGVGGSYYEFNDSQGHLGYLFPPAMTANRAWVLPNSSGTLCTTASCLPSVSGTNGNLTSINSGSLADTGIAATNVVTAASNYTNGNLVQAAGNNKTTSDSGIAASSVATSSSSTTFTNKTLDVEGTGNNITTVSKVVFEAAGCVNGTPALMWDTGASGAPTAGGCTGSNVIQGTADFADGSSLCMQKSTNLPSDWTGAIDANIKWLSAGTSGNAQWFVKLLCVADAETNDPAFANSSNVIDAVKGTTLQTNDASITGVTSTGCAAGEMAHIQVCRDATGGNASDTLASTASILNVGLTFRRTQ